MTLDDSQTASWQSLAPWEKAAQWREAAPDIADQVMLLATRHAEHQWRMQKDQAQHERKMDVRRWMTQLVALVIGLGDVAALAAVAWHYADTGNVVPGLAMFGAGTTLTAGAYVVAHVIGKQSKSSLAKSTKPNK